MHGRLPPERVLSSPLRSLRAAAPCQLIIHLVGAEVGGEGDVAVLAEPPGKRVPRAGTDTLTPRHFVVLHKEKRLGEDAACQNSERKNFTLIFFLQ